MMSEAILSRNTTTTYNDNLITDNVSILLHARVFRLTSATAQLYRVTRHPLQYAALPTGCMKRRITSVRLSLAHDLLEIRKL